MMLFRGDRLNIKSQQREVLVVDGSAFHEECEMPLKAEAVPLKSQRERDSQSLFRLTLRKGYSSLHGNRT